MVTFVRSRDEVDIKRLPDGTSRGFAFVKFVEARVHIDGHAVSIKTVQVAVSSSLLSMALS